MEGGILGSQESEAGRLEIGICQGRLQERWKPLHK
jgi:hypothetical protein